VSDGPKFDDLVGEDLAPEERARLERVHDLLVAAGPPPELPPKLVTAPESPKAEVIPLRRERWRTAIIAAAAALVISFGAGWLVGDRHASGHVEFTLEMSGATGAQATLDVLSVDAAGNWPMRMQVSGLPALPRGHTYALWLTKKGVLDSQCGTFTVAGEGTTTVRLNAPYKLKEYSGWVVVESGTQKPLLQTSTV
jgi:Anti-sigma-K factor rskA, C-terminal